MSVHYSDQRALASSQAKREVLQLFFDLARHHVGAREILDKTGGMLPTGTFTWEDLARLHHQYTTRTALSPNTHPPLTHPPAAQEQLALQDQGRDRGREGRRARSKSKKDKKARKRAARESTPGGKRPRASPKAS